MSIRVNIFIFLFVTACGSVAVCAQGADERAPSLFRRHREEDLPRSVLETREKMRIEKEKKDYAEMLERGEETLRLTERVALSFSENGRLSDMDLASLESVEKDVKKIRSDLGGDDDDENVDDIIGPKKPPTIAEAVTSLKVNTENLFDELKKTTRFSISAAAIQSSNAVITIARFLRLGK